MRCARGNSGGGGSDEEADGCSGAGACGSAGGVIGAGGNICADVDGAVVAPHSAGAICAACSGWRMGATTAQDALRSASSKEMCSRCRRAASYTGEAACWMKTSISPSTRCSVSVSSSRISSIRIGSSMAPLAAKYLLCKTHTRRTFHTARRNNPRARGHHTQRTLVHTHTSSQRSTRGCLKGPRVSSQQRRVCSSTHDCDVETLP